MALPSRDISKARFERIVAQWPVGIKRERQYWLCICDCGTVKIIRKDGLTSGLVKSCGCYGSENTSRRLSGNQLNLKHGHSRKKKPYSPEYQSWSAMIQRCTNPKATGYERYGALGITICERWLDFKNFLADMGLRPKRKSLDRFPNPYGNYEPGNCRWATSRQQNKNRRILKKVVQS